MPGFAFRDIWPSRTFKRLPYYPATPSPEPDPTGVGHLLDDYRNCGHAAAFGIGTSSRRYRQTGGKLLLASARRGGRVTASELRRSATECRNRGASVQLLFNLRMAGSDVNRLSRFAFERRELGHFCRSQQQPRKTDFAGTRHCPLNRSRSCALRPMLGRSHRAARLHPPDEFIERVVVVARSRSKLCLPRS